MKIFQGKEKYLFANFIVSLLIKNSFRIYLEIIFWENRGRNDGTR
jgi:hypothetical protein